MTTQTAGPVGAGAGHPTSIHQEQHMSLTPNPSSPFATATPDVRHILPSTLGNPRPGALVLTDCDRLAVVPTEPLTDAHSLDPLPDGLCPDCIAAMQGVSRNTEQPSSECRECAAVTRHDGLCVLCRMDAHDEWWAQQQADPSA
ncbi:hypothetical protein ACTVZO_05295 [Streptomyces sp. IBSNAI002]|uniref:hypothetical protein n=1 Tax=Streptomyces sp. IBSNAI002 TaxID=3457500 RepID=UPI003FD4D0AD